MLSLCTIARDEAELLPGMLESVYGFVQDIVIGVDDRTTDKTAEIAADYGARVFLFEWRDSFAEARNLTLERARGEWTLVIDPDERLTKEGVDRMRAAIESTRGYDGYRPLLQEVDSNGTPLGEPSLVSGRLFRDLRTLRYVGRVHEEVRYLPMPQATHWSVLPGGPHIVGIVRDHEKRNRRLLSACLRDDPNDAKALYYLAKMAAERDHPRLAAAFARRALTCGADQLNAAICARLAALAA